MDKKQENKKPRQPNDVGSVKISDSLKIIDRDTKEVIVEKTNVKPKY